jgi:hypothetical protein
MVESIAGWFFLENNTVEWLADQTDNLKRTGYRQLVHSTDKGRLFDCL